MTVDFIRRLPSLVIVGPSRRDARQLEQEVEHLLGDRLPRLRVVVSCKDFCSARDIADAILQKAQGPGSPKRNPLGKLSADLGARIFGEPPPEPRRRRASTHPQGTRAGVTAAIKRLRGVKARHDGGEYRVAYTGLSPLDEEVSAFYTRDADAAIQKAHAMAEMAKAQSAKPRKARANPAKATVATVNAALRKRGLPYQLNRGQGYFWFSGGDAHRWPSSSVLMSPVGSLTVAEWLHELAALRAAHGA